MKSGIWGVVGVGVVLGFWGCGGSESGPLLEGATGGKPSSVATGGAANKSGGSGGAMAMAGANAVGMGGGLSTTCPTLEPKTMDKCTGIVRNTMCTYPMNVCNCGRGDFWSCQDIRCPVAAAVTGDLCPGNDGLRCNYPNRTVCNCAGGTFKCIQTQPQSCPMAQPRTGDACNGLGGTFCDYNLPMASMDVSSAGAAGQLGAGGANAAGSAGVASSAGAGGMLASGGANAAGAAGGPAAVACGCSPQTQKWFCF